MQFECLLQLITRMKFEINQFSREESKRIKKKSKKKIGTKTNVLTDAKQSFLANFAACISLLFA